MEQMVQNMEKFAKNQNRNLEYMSNIVSECLENALSYFGFEQYFIEIQGFDEVKLKIKFRNVDHVGNYVETYYLNIYETCENGIFDSTACLVGFYF